MPSGFLGQLVVNFVLLLICFIAYSSQIFIIWPWYGRVLSVELVTLLLPFNIFVGLLLWNYFLSVYTDPGRVPDNWKPDTNADGYEVKRLTEHIIADNAEDVFCEWTTIVRGLTIVLDTTTTATSSASFSLLMSPARIILPWSGGDYILAWATAIGLDEPDGTEMIFMILNMVACIPVLLCVGIFSLYHFNAIRNNTTTIERWEKDKVATMVRRGRIQEIKFPYNIGTRRNIESVLGKNHWLWCWPTKTPGSGLKYEITSNDENSDGESWPPHHDTIEGESSHKEFSLPDSPWTFENGTVNPTLQPSNSARRRAKNNGASTLPPYHPDYQPDASDSDDYDEDDTSRVRIRRGSEGYEVRPGNREDMLNRYLSEIGEKRYHYYVPEPASGSESEGEQAPLVKSG